MPTKTLDQTLDQIAGHLQFLGYETSQDGESMIAKHAQKMNVMFKNLKGGILFMTLMSCQNSAKSDEIGYLRFINLLNTSAAVVRFYTDKDFYFHIEAWYPKSYEKTEFGIFWDAWEKESFLFMADKEQAVKYLK